MATNKLLTEMGNRILERRKQLRMTQEELAEKINVTPQMISTAELGKKAIRPENLLKICNVLGISADYVLTGKITYNDTCKICDKLRTLDASRLHHIENIIDECIALCNKSENEIKIDSSVGKSDE